MLRKPSEIVINGENFEEVLNERKNPLILVSEDLCYTDLKDVNLSYADLCGADLSCTDLRYADLSYADLRYANLSYADLRGTNLCNANFKGAILLCADLRGTNLCNANFKGAILNEVKYNHETAFFAIQCPEEGSFIGYKKVSNKIIKLLILEDSKRSSATSRKCRCDKAKVLSIESVDGEEMFTEVKSDFDSNFIYKVGEIVKVDNFCEDRWKECAAGIHFFITRQEAINY